MTDTGTIGGELSPPTLWRWAKALFVNPRAFFRDLERKGGYWTPALYLLAWSFVSGLIGFLVSLLRPAPPVAGLGAMSGRVAQTAGVFIGPFLVLAFAFLAAGILFVIWHLMGSKEDYQASFRCWAFMAPVSAVGSVLGVVPFLPLLAMAYTFYLVVLASEEVHGISSRRAWTVWGSLGTAMLLVLLIAAAAGVAMRSRGGLPAGGASSPLGRSYR